MIVREQARDLGDREYEDEVEEELERGDLVLVAALVLALDLGHAWTLAQPPHAARNGAQRGGQPSVPRPLWAPDY